MRVLVTGATGFVATHLVPRLAAEGHEVHALGHDADRIVTDGGVRAVVADLSRPLEPGALPQVDAVVHMAQANVPFPDGATQLLAVNAGSTLELLDHARRTGARSFVFTSSASVYGLGDRRYREEDAPAASDFYSFTKLTAERLVASYSEFFSTVVLRLVAPYGPGQRGRLIPSLVQRVREGRPVTLNDGGRPAMNPIYVADVVELLTRALAVEGHRVVNVAGDEPATIRDLAELIGRAVGRDPVFETGTGAAGDLVVENRRMHELLGGRPLVPLADGLAQTAAAA